MIYSISRMTHKYALKISQWTYQNEYGIYSFEQNAETIEELL